MGKVFKLESKSQNATPSRISMHRRFAEHEPSHLTPELKDFIDRVIVPILVKSYLALRDPES